MARWTVEVIPAAERELRALPDDLQAKFLHVVGLLEEFGPAAVGLLTSGRSSGSSGKCACRNTIARAISHAASRRRVVVVRVFVKKSPKAARREIALAERRMREQEGG